MPYDRDSFLAGLAVGRTLWQPTNADEGFTAQRSRQQTEEQDTEETEQEENAV